MRKPVEVFDEWAKIGKDEGMEKGHAAAVEEMLGVALAEVAQLGHSFRAVDAGCGNGWVVRQLSQMPFCKRATGIDGAVSMIEKARSTDPEGDYVHTDLLSWSPPNPVDLIHSMEVFYYLEDSAGLLEHIASWLSPGGYLIFGVDRYQENPESHDWDEQVGCYMALLSEAEWRAVVESAGLEVRRCWRAAPREDWPGTLAILAQKP